MRQSKSSLLSVMNSFKMRLLLLRDLVVNRAILRGFCFEMCAEEVGTGQMLKALTGRLLCLRELL